MITLKEIKTYLENSINPLFFFDDDTDGLCSFLLLYRYFKKGNFIALKSSPALEEIYIRKVQEYSPDLIIVLDKPILNREFVKKVNVPIIWIDHHPPHPVEGVKYFNPLIINKNDNRPTSYWCYKIVNQDLLLGNIGMVGDYSLVKLKALKKNYPNLIKAGLEEPDKILFETELGKLIRILNFLLKGRVSEVRKRISILIRIDDVSKILKQETAMGKYLYKTYEKINKVYTKFLDKAIKTKPRNKLLVFTYVSRDFSFTGDLANELLYKYPNKIILVAREKSGEMKLSMRSNYKGKIIVRDLLEKAIVGIKGYGGGHEHAVGGNIENEDFIKFVENLENLIK